MREVKPGEIYKHFKGNLYQIVAIANDSETNKKVVVYQALYGDMSIWVRPYDMFVSEVDHNKYPEVNAQYRFELVSTLASATNMQRVAPLASAEPVSRVTNQPAQQTISQPSQQTMSQQAVQTVTAPSTVYCSNDEEQVDQRLLDFLDIDTIQGKIDYLNYHQKRIDDRLIDDIAAAMDLVVDNGPIDARFYSLKNCLMMKAKYEFPNRR